MSKKYSNAIFNYIKPNENNQFSTMSMDELHVLFKLLNDYYLDLRGKLNFKSIVTFGLEIEFEHAETSNIHYQLYHKFSDDDWHMKDDISLVEGAEITSPILRDSKETWRDLSNVCYIINKSATIDNKSGGHIHVGTQVLGDDKKAWLNFLKLWATYENIIYRFSYGEFATSRVGIMNYADMMADKFINDYHHFVDSSIDLCDILNVIAKNRNQAVNFGNVDDMQFGHFDLGNTIEFRCPNGTLNPIIWQNNVNLFVNLLLYSRSKLYNNGIIDSRMATPIDRTLSAYNEIYLEQALEFCDMIFHNNLDKIYFLKQYIKSFEVGNRPLVKAKKFTK